MDQSEQFPLHIDFGFGSEGEMVQPFMDTDVGKDRLNDSKTPGVDAATMRRIDPGFHGFNQTGSLAFNFHREKATRGIGLAQTISPHRTRSAIFRTSAIDIIDPVAIWLAARTAFQELALRTAIALIEVIKDEV